ncbi:hypothetical protein JIG36_23900 [Actinoplanes sp. LDG1-06]|uniref:Uncharacterized protein n=1 Tax=Paractinoplanes ovalisporus TaxID=2810368 RepID=A0ABS2AHB3_9ACTN|nr:hypothetical protein [Actinoplanes ovalisporus]MBM2618604.1 hypothetical protein [Actinoplanes ovalisporus]
MAEQYLTAYAVDPSRVVPTDPPVGKATLPGRHWDELTPAFAAWGLTALADLWSRPWPTTAGDPWPFPMYADPAHVARIEAELAAFDITRVHDECDLLPDGDDDADEVAWLLTEKLPQWLQAARTSARGLYILRDGAK